ncbi:MAG TPA: bifunctional biotin--[acetyl-CoA-carboxylase] ligase/biotin operon repressor BirA [Gammaproteobacteria bacterium]|nr:bifunctional biotin--[acetyl-CoA-carboxylase] ligase/biotin operon repressor BirA [Gammaproteobacteria bacterium]
MSTHNDHSDAVLRVLADGQFHSGEHLARQIGVSRSAVWKQVKALAGLGLEVFRVPGKGYRLAAPLELLDAARIRAGLAPAHRARLGALHVLHVVDSTSTWLAAHAPVAPAACLAEMQTAGRGRRGRHWVSPFAANLYLSCVWQFEELPPGFTALGMAAAIAAARALHACGARNVAVKWPNDLVAGGAKLGGILVDVQGEPSGGLRAVIGVGINVRMPAQAAPGIDQPWTDLVSQLNGVVPGRNALAASLLDELFRALECFGAQGFAAFGDDWRALDQVAGRTVVLQQHDQRISGTALGVDRDGALLLETGGETRRFVSGDISLRVQA